MRPFLLLAACLVLVAACGQPRRFGDEGGVPVAVHVTLDRAFVQDMKNRQGRVGVGVGAGISSGGSSTFGTGVGVGFSSTVVSLLGGDNPAGAQVFRRELRWGGNDFTVPLRPGRTLHLTIQVEGGREGWEEIGSVVAPAAAGGSVRITLAGGGPAIAVEGGTVTTTTSTTEPASPQPAAPAPAAPPPAPAPAP